MEIHSRAGRRTISAVPTGLLVWFSQAGDEARYWLFESPGARVVIIVAVAAIGLAGYFGFNFLAKTAGWPDFSGVFVLLLLALLAVWLIYSFSSSWDRGGGLVMGALPVIRYAGEATLPAKVYEGDSREVSLSLIPSAFLLPDEHDEGALAGQGKVRLALDVPLPEYGGGYLETELLAAAVKVDGDKKQRQPLTRGALVYRWSCFFDNSGRHALTLVFRVGTPARSKEIATFRHEVLVAKLDHMTKRQVWLISVAAGLVTFVSTVLTILDKLHLLGGGPKPPGQQ
jgi:hypothetical protein